MDLSPKRENINDSDNRNHDMHIMKASCLSDRKEDPPFNAPRMILSKALSLLLATTGTLRQ